MRITAALAVGASVAVLAVSGCSATGGTATAGRFVEVDQSSVNQSTVSQSSSGTAPVVEITHSPGATAAVRVGERFTLAFGLRIVEPGGHVVEDGDGVWRAVSNGTVTMQDYSKAAPCSDVEPEIFDLTVYGGDETLSDGLRRAPADILHRQCR